MKVCYKNILKLSTVTLVTGTEDANYPLSRLSDGKIGEPFQTTAAVTTTIKIDQGASPLPDDRLLIIGHNLNSMTLDIKHSDDDITYTPTTAQWSPADTAIIDKSWNSVTHRYRKFIITSPGVIPSICELFLGSTWVWEKDASRRESGPFDNVPNMERDVTKAGAPRYLINGDPKRQRPYVVHNANETMKTNALACRTEFDKGRPFFLFDHDGVWIFSELTGPLDLQPKSYQKYDFKFPCLEVLP